MQDSKHDFVSLKEFLTVKETAETLDLDQSTVRRMIYAGKLEAYRAGSKAIRIPRAAILEMLEPAAPWAVAK